MCFIVPMPSVAFSYVFAYRVIQIGDDAHHVEPSDVRHVSFDSGSVGALALSYIVSSGHLPVVLADALAVGARRVAVVVPVVFFINSAVVNQK